MKTQTPRQDTMVIESFTSRSSHTSAMIRTPFGCRTTLTAMLMLLAIAVSFPRNAVAQQTTATASQGAAPGSQAMTRILIPAPLGSSLDSKKLKTGDEVILKTSANLSLQDGSTIPRGTKVVGHVTEAKARSKGDAASSLAIAFDKLDLPGGKTMVISGVIQAVGPNPSDAVPGGGGVGYTDVAEATYSPSVSVAARSVPLLNNQSVGVVGIKNLQLAADGVLTSDSKSVKLDSGMQMLLQVQNVLRRINRERASRMAKGGGRSGQGSSPNFPPTHLNPGCSRQSRIRDGPALHFSVASTT